VREARALSQRIRRRLQRLPLRLLRRLPWGWRVPAAMVFGDGGFATVLAQMRAARWGGAGVSNRECLGGMGWWASLGILFMVRVD
jgi:hypothetical protein